MKKECASMKKYSIGLFALFLGCVALIGAAYQFSFEYSKNQAKEEARLKTGNCAGGQGRGGCHSR